MPVHGRVCASVSCSRGATANFFNSRGKAHPHHHAAQRTRLITAQHKPCHISFLGPMAPFSLWAGGAAGLVRRQRPPLLLACASGLRDPPLLACSLQVLQHYVDAQERSNAAASLSTASVYALMKPLGLRCYRRIGLARRSLQLMQTTLERWTAER